MDITVRRSPRARRLSLRVSSLDGRVTLTLPNGVPFAEAESFARERQDWIQKARAKTCPIQPIVNGGDLLVEGRVCEISVEARRAPVREGDILRLPRRAPGKAAAGFLKLLARDRVSEACDRHSKALGKPYAALTLRDTRSRWGSCSAAGRLMFSWRLAMAPPAVLNYVAAHEVAHLEWMDHSANFWSVVEDLDPTWRDHRTWLREHGARLHAYQFGD